MSLFQHSTAKNEINLFNNHVLIVAPVTFAPAGANVPSGEFWFPPDFLQYMGSTLYPPRQLFLGINITLDESS